MKVIILAGGSGKRLWPLSSRNLPKQFLSFDGADSLLVQTVKRFSEEETLIITGRRYLKIAKNQLRPSYTGTILTEPKPRNTAPAICLGLKYLLEKGGNHENDICMVCPSDHYFESTKDLSHLVQLAKKAVGSGAIITLGITPTHQETEYGYIQVDGTKGVFRVTRFIEKPHPTQVRELLDEGNCYWNAGIFLFQIGFFLSQLRKYAPPFFLWFSQPYEQALASFSSLPSISIDYALMEKTPHLFLLPYPSLWSDLGSWERLSATLSKDEEGNVLRGDIQAMETEECIIFGKGIQTLGVKDLLIIKVRGRVIICHRKEAHRLIQLRKPPAS